MNSKKNKRSIIVIKLYESYNIVTTFKNSQVAYKSNDKYKVIFIKFNLIY
jgi:hypothetical protein